MTSALAIGLAVAAGAAWYYATLLDTGVRGSPDGRFYLTAGAGEPVPRVYAIKFLLPRLLRSNAVLWQLFTAAHLMALPGAVAAYALAAGLTPPRALVAGLLTLGLSGLWRINVELPVLVDAPALVWSALAAAALLSGWTALGVCLAAVAAAIKEPAPLFIAAAAASPWGLLALLVPVSAWCLAKDVPAPDWAPWLHLRPGLHPRHGSKRYTDAFAQVAPWGIALPAALAAPTAALWWSLAAGYGVLLGGYVGPRYQQWAWLPVVAGAAAVLPDWALGPAVLAQLFNPWRGTGL